jgi:hypothetical protein
MVMRRAGKASPEAISAERTPLAGFGDRLVRQADNGKGGHSWRNLHLYVDRAHFDALERDGGDPLDHFSPFQPWFSFARAPLARFLAHGQPARFVERPRQPHRGVKNSPRTWFRFDG